MKNMTLYDLMELTEDGFEMEVTDADYDILTYFYSAKEGTPDIWDDAMVRLAKLLKVTRILYGYRIEVNLGHVIESKLSELEVADLFIECDMESIMDDIDNILAGYVSESWMQKFVTILEGKENGKDD